MKQQILELIDRKIEKYRENCPLKLAEYRRAISLFEELRSEIENMEDKTMSTIDEMIEEYEDKINEVNPEDIMWEQDLDRLIGKKY